MQVTYMKDHVTHAVIAPGNVQEFGISQSAEFFQMLSSSLYSDKMLAVVRETLCNAWDAHIEAGITGTPVEVTIDNKRLVIRDFGSGIPDSMIGPIYGVYGKSTKVSNDNVTGGFGLGCKSPFAYSDHFETTSWSEGRMTIYSMSLSSAMVGGRPSITTMLSTPTDDNGLQVAIDLKEPNDRHRFEKLVRRIASFGEMNVKLNGEVIHTIPFSVAKHGFVILNSNRLPDDYSTQKIHIRYGNVVYPLEIKDDYSSEYKQATEILSQLNGAGRSRWDNATWIVVLQAKPNTVSVTPSRESLSMTAHTIQTVTELLKDFAQHSYGKLEDVCLKYVKEATSTLWLNSTPASLLNKPKSLPNSDYFSQLEAVNVITDIDQAGLTYLKASNQYPSQNDLRTFKKREFDNRLNALIEAGFGKAGLINSFRHSYKRGEFDNISAKMSNGSVWAANKFFVGKNPLSAWVQRRMIWPLLQGLTEAKELEAKRLHVIIKNPKYNSALPYAFTEASKFYPSDIEAVLPLLRGVVVVAHNRMDVADRVDEFPMMKHWFGQTENNLLYICQRNPIKAEAAVKFFEERGYAVVNLTKAHKWEPEDAHEAVAKIAGPAKKKKAGVPRLDQLLQRFTDEEKLKNPTAVANLLPVYAWMDDAERIEAPEFVVTIGPTRENIDKLGTFRHNTVRPIVTLFGDKGGIVANSKQEEKYREAGALSLEKWLPPKLEHEWVHNPLIEQYFRNKSHGNRADYYQHGSRLTYTQDELLKVIKQDPELRKLYGFPDPLPKREQNLITIWKSLDGYDLRAPEWKVITELTVTWTPSKELQTFIDQTAENHLLSLFDTSSLLSTIVGHKSVGRVQIANAAREMLLNALLS